MEICIECDCIDYAPLPLALRDVIDMSTGTPRDGWTDLGGGAFVKPAESSYLERLGYSAPAPDSHHRKGRVRLS